MRYTFGDCEFDSDSFELKRANAVVETTPQVLSILQFLLTNHARLVTKDELVNAIWDGRAISDAAITVRIRALRQAIGDSGSEQRVIRTIRGRGFRFVSEVTTHGGNAVKPFLLPTREPIDLNLPPKIAVLPFRLVGRPGTNAYLAEAFPDEIITALSRLRTLSVVARGSSFRFPSFTTEPRALGAQLGVNYCASGEMEISGKAMNFSVELTETENETVLWRDRVPVPLAEVHELRAEIVQRIATALDQQVTRNELARAQIQVPNSLSAWQNFHSGMSLLYGIRQPDLDAAESFFNNAIHSDPHFARANAGLANIQISTLFYGWDREMRSRIKALQSAATNAYSLDPLDPFCVMTAARMDVVVHRGEGAIEKLQRAIELGPSEYQAHGDLARMFALSGKLPEAERHLATEDRLHPLTQTPLHPLVTHMIVALGREDAETAVEFAAKVRQLPVQTVYSATNVLTAYHLAGRYDEAATIARACRRDYPDLSGERLMYGLPGLSDHLRRLYTESFAAHDLL